MSPKRKWFWSPIWDVPILFVLGLGVVAFLLALLGWMLVPELGVNLGDRAQLAFYRALSVNTLSGDYSGSFAGEGIEAPARHLLNGARWIGTLTFSLLLLKAYQGLFSERFTRWRAQGKSGHVVVIGDTPFARAAAEEASKHHGVVWASTTSSPGVFDRLTRIQESGDGEAMVKATAADKARSVLVSLAEDSRTFTATSEMLRAKKIFASEAGATGEPLEGPHFFAIVSDRWNAYPDEAAKLIDPLRGLGADSRRGGLDSVGEVITEARTAARAMLGNVPLFQLAGEKPQHVLILGLGELGEAILTEICESQRTHLHARQRVTVIDRSAAAWTRFTARVPGHSEVFDGHFFSIAAENADAGVWQDLLAHLARHEVTAAYVTSGGANQSRLAASELRTHLVQACDETDEGAAAYAALAFPIFAYSRASSIIRIDELKRTALASKALAEDRMPILSFGAWSEMVSAARLFDEEPDAHAFDIHDTHRRLYAKSGERPTLWRDLTEWQRYSSRSASAYTAALLHAAGYDLGEWYAAAQSSDTAATLNNLPRLADIPDFNKEIPLLMMLARLEHARWCAERRLKGYRWGPVKDPGRRQHPGLVDFDDLDTGSQGYNIEYIKSLFVTLRDKDSDLVVRRPFAPRAIARPTDISLLKRLGMLPGAPAPQATEAGDGGV